MRSVALSQVLCCGRNLSGEGKSVFSYLPMRNTLAWKGLEQATFQFYTGPMALHCVFRHSEDPLTIFGWGRSSEGQLSEKHSQRLMISPGDPLQVTALGTTAQSISCGTYHTVLALESGEINSFGRNAHGELASDLQSSKEHSFRLQEGKRTIYPRNVVSGADYTLLLSQCGKIYSWGRNEEGQLGRSAVQSTSQAAAIPNIPKVHSISTGWGHSISIADEGRLYAWGANNHGQVGNNIKSKGENVPCEIELPEPFSLPYQRENSRKPVTVHPEQVQCGGTNSLLLAKEKSSSRSLLFVWGSHKDGKLGLEDCTEDQIQPTLLPSITNPTLVSSGCDHTIAVCQNKNIWGWGFSQHLSLGSGMERKVMNTPHRLSLNNVSQILCGQDDTLFYVENTNGY